MVSSVHLGHLLELQFNPLHTANRYSAATPQSFPNIQGVQKEASHSTQITVSEQSAQRPRELG